MKSGIMINNQYEIKNLIHQGEYAATYLAWEEKLKRDVVLKVISLKQVKDWKILDLFDREIKVLKNLNHPMVPDYYNHFQLSFNQEEYFILVQEYIKGETLDELIKNGRHFNLDEVKGILIKLLEILSYLHNIQPPVIHRDINPKNIIITETGKVYLVDFGAVGKIVEDTITAAKSSTFVGTLGYMAQEQLFGKALPASDLYSLGMTMLYMLTGKDPSSYEFNGSGISYHADVHIPDKLKILLDKMIEPNYQKRLSDAQKALDYLDGKIELTAARNMKGIYGITVEENLNEKVIVLPKNKFAANFLLLFGGIWAFVGTLLTVIFAAVSIETFGAFIMLPGFFAVTGFVFMVSGIVKRNKKQKIVMDLEKLTVLTMKGNRVIASKAIYYSEYQGAEPISIGAVNHETIYKLQLYGEKENFSVGSGLKFAQIKFLKESIEKEING